MTRGLGAALALSVLVHGGVVAAIVVVGVAWLGEPRPAVEPALYVDAVDPVVATGERRASAVASRPRAEAPQGPDGHAARRMPPDSPPADAPAPAPAPSRSTAMSGPIEVIAGAMPPAPPVAPAVPRVEEPRVEPPAAVVATTPPPATATPAAPAPGPSAARPAPSSTVAALASLESVASDAALTARRAPAPPAASAGEGKAHASALVASSPAIGGPAVTGPATAGPAATGPATPGGPASGGAGETPRSGEPGAAAGSGPATQAGSGSGNVARLPPADGGGAGPGGGIPPEYEAYVRALRQRVQERLVYPWTAVRRGLEGVVELEVRVGADGRLVGVEVVAGANADSLRSAAVAAVRGAAPFPFPSGLAARPLVIRLPVEFRLR